MKAAGPRVSTTFNDEVSEGGRIPSLAYIGEKGVFAIFFVNILNLLLKIIQVCVQVADFILKWRKEK